nr:unnamed protein product [Callosobruchus chinensis]
MMTGRPPLEKAVQRTRKNLSKALKDFERLFLSENKKYIVGDQISFADVQAACEIDQLSKYHNEACVNSHTSYTSTYVVHFYISTERASIVHM